MAAAFDDLLFNKSTFADLGAANQLPSIVINATNLSSRRTFTFINKMPTRFFLKGPKGCSTANNQDALFEAARALVREDVEAVRQVCDWMAK
jgi:hypothetical protein